MNKFNVIIVIAVSLLFTACFSKAVERDAKSGPEWQVLLREKHSAFYEPRNILIKSQNELDALWKESQMGIDFGPAKPKVDFSRKWIIAFFLGMVRTSGHSVDIESVKPGNTTTLITLVHKRPRSGCLTAQVIEYPYLMASVDHFSPEKAEFKVVTQELPCE